MALTRTRLCRLSLNRPMVGRRGSPRSLLVVNSEISGRVEEAEWIAGQIRDVLGVELAIEPVDGTTLIALRKDIATHPQLSVLRRLDPGLPRSSELAQRLLDVRFHLRSARGVLQRGVRRAH